MLVPGHRELLPVLWGMGTLPDVYGISTISDIAPVSREESITSAMQGIWLPPDDQDKARRVIEANSHDLFEESGEGYRPLWQKPSKELLITWETC